MNTRIEDEHANPVLSSVMRQPFHVDLAAPAQSLSKANSLLTIDLGGILLTWFNALLPDYEIVNGVLNAQFELNTDDAGNVMLAPRQNLVIDGIRIDSDGTPVIENVKITLTPHIKSTSV